jgi:hypothetical protein
LDEALDQLFNGVEAVQLPKQHGINPVAHGLVDLAGALSRLFGGEDAMRADRITPQVKPQPPMRYSMIDAGIGAILLKQHIVLSHFDIGSSRSTSDAAPD